MQEGRLQDIGSESTAGQHGLLGSECRTQVHGVIPSAPGRESEVTMWVCGSAASAQGIAESFPSSMPGLSSVPAKLGPQRGIDVSAQDNVLVWVAAPRSALAYETAERLRDLLGERSS
jgi:hypothetical protein